MLIGEYSHSLDVKGRVNFPSKLRDDLGDCFIITKGLDKCLFAYSMDEWKNLEEKVRALPLSKSRTLQRFIFAGAAEVTVDKQGRINIPSNLRDYAGLKKDITIVGVSARVEIWDKESYETMNDELDPQMIAQAMDEMDF